jgi:siroheme synthase-like protein
MNFPLALDLSERLCLVIGVSAEARARVERFVRVGARVRWLTSAGAEAFEPAWAERVDVLARPWQASDLDDCWLVVLADRDAATAAALRAACDERRRFFCAIDQTAFNSFNHVALIEQGPVQVAISTGGKVPALARKLRQELEKLFGDGRLARFAERLAQEREQAAAEDRRDVLRTRLDGVEIEGRLVLPDDGTD